MQKLHGPWFSAVISVKYKTALREWVVCLMMGTMPGSRVPSRANIDAKLLHEAKRDDAHGAVPEGVLVAVLEVAVAVAVAVAGTRECAVEAPRDCGTSRTLLQVVLVDTFSGVIRELVMTSVGRSSRCVLDGRDDGPAEQLLDRRRAVPGCGRWLLDLLLAGGAETLTWAETDTPKVEQMPLTLLSWVPRSGQWRNPPGL